MNQQTTVTTYPFSTEIFACQLSEYFKSNKDDKEMFEKDPKATLCEYLLKEEESSLMEGFTIKMHHNSADTWHLTIPCYSALYEEVEDIIADAHLENISAGEIFASIGALIITICGVSAATAAGLGTTGAAVIGAGAVGAVACGAIGAGAAGAIGHVATSGGGGGPENCPYAGAATMCP